MLALSLSLGAPPAEAAARRAQAELAQPLASALAAAVDAAVAEDMSQLGIPGLSLAIAQGDTLRFAAGYGHADVENAVPAAADTVYRLASVSKPMTAVAVLQLAERGRLELDAPAWQYCAGFPAKPWTLTPRQLLCHQGGVRHYRADEERLPRRRFTSVVEPLAFFSEDALAFEPGTAVLYSTYGYCLLGCVVEGAAGRPFADVLRDEVFGPAGMTGTQVDDPRVLIPRRANGYVRSSSGELLNSELADVTYKVPGGGLCGTAPDVAQFGAALLAGRLLGRPTLEQMLTPQRVRSGRQTGFGLGLTVSPRRGRREAWHTGGQQRVSTLLYLRPEAGLAVAILCNLERVQGPLLDLGRRIADLLTADRLVR